MSGSTAVETTEHLPRNSLRDNVYRIFTRAASRLNASRLSMFPDARNVNIEHATFINQNGTLFLDSSRPVAEAAAEGQTMGGSIVAPSEAREYDPALSSPRKSPDVYVDCLLTKIEGYPLYIPSPDRNLPPLHRTHGISLGDVGILTPEGGFDFLFNIFHDATDPINGVLGAMPEAFSPFKPPPVPADIRYDVPSDVDSIFGDAYMRRVDDGRDRSITTFEATGTEGAVLIVPEKLHITKLKRKTRLHKYIAENIVEWYRFVKHTLERDIENGDLRVVYGCGKSSGFGIATAFNNGQQENTRLTFLVENSNADSTWPSYRWNWIGSAICKTGSSQQDHLSDSPTEPTRNQCLFLNTISTEVSTETWKEMVEPETMMHVMPNTTSGTTDRGEREPTAASSSASSASGSKNSLPSSPFNQRAFHPSVILHDILKTITPELLAYIVCDDDWAHLVSYTASHTHDFVDKILETKLVVEVQGMLFFCFRNDEDLLEEVSQRGGAQISFTRIAPIDSPSTIGCSHWRAERRVFLGIEQRAKTPVRSELDNTLLHSPAATVPSLMTTTPEKIHAIFGNASRNIRQASKPLNNAINTDQSRIDMPSISRNATTASMFSAAHNNFFHDNTFVTNVKSGPSLDLLVRRVAPNAILNAGGHADEARRHSGTHKKVIGQIDKWADEQDSQTAPLCWLTGPAGVGKSAIMQTVAKRCMERSVPQANFFFFREDTSRNHASRLIATLLHQILRLYPLLRDPVTALLANDPLIFDSSLENQLTELIVIPLRIIQQSSPAYSPLIILIDGLDECDSETEHGQQKIIDAFDKVLAERHCPCRLLIASRSEPQIVAAFNRISSPFLCFDLDGQDDFEDDIRILVDALFAQIKQAHPLAHTLDLAWPSVEDVEDIVKRSSGEIIYAATVMRFIWYSPASPMLSLQRVQGSRLARSATRSPFHELDALYTNVLTWVDDQQALKDILHAYFAVQHNEFVITSQLTLQQILRAYSGRYTNAVIRSCIADISAIARFESGKLVFYHASMADYLLDQSRSGEYFVDTRAFTAKIQPRLLKLAEEAEKARQPEGGGSRAAEDNKSSRTGDEL